MPTTTQRPAALPARLRVLLFGALAGMAGAAAADVYKCVDAGGRILYTDSNRAGCKALDVPGAIAAPAARSERSGRAAAAPAAPLATPADFPRVDGAQQRARDSERRAILEDELHAEEKKLAALQKDFNHGEPERNGNERNYAKYQERVGEMRDGIGRAEKNIEALKREIGGIR